MSEQARPARDAASLDRAPAARGMARRKARAFDQPRFLSVFTALVFAYLFAPIVVVFLFSFNSKRSTQVFGQFSTTWYQQLFKDQSMLGSLQVSIEIAFVTMIAATILATLLAFGLVRSRSRLT